MTYKNFFRSNRNPIGVVVLSATIFLWGAGISHAQIPLEISDGSIMGLWHLNGNSVDASNKNHNGTDTIIVYSLANGKLGEGAGFNGSMIDFGNNFDMNGAESRSWSLWFKPSSLSGIKYIFAKGDDVHITHTAHGYWFTQVDNRLYWTMNGGNGYGNNEIQMQTGAVLDSTSSWYHIVITYDGSSLASGVHIYVNTVDETIQVDQNSLSNSVSNTVNFVVGAGSDGSRHNDIDIDELVEFNQVISAATRQGLYNSGQGREVCATSGCVTGSSTAPGGLYSTALAHDPSLISYYRLDGNSNDANGNNNGIDTSIAYSTSSGVFGQGAGFNGNSSSILLPTNPWANKAAGSVSAWFYIPRDATFPIGGGCCSYTFRYVFGSTSYSAGQNGNELGFRINSDGSDWWTPNNGVTAWSNLTGTWKLGQWYHVTIIWDGAHAILYQNGVPISTQDFVAKSGSATAPEGLGVNWDGNPFYGSMDDVAIFSRALTAAEVANIYHAGFSQTAPGVTLLHQFKSNGTTSLGEGSTTSENSVVLSAQLNSSTTDQLQLQVEYTTSTTFSGTPNATSSLVNPGSVATVAVHNLQDSNYRWRARAFDQTTNQASDWQEFGTPGNVDFIVSMSPIAPYQPELNLVCPRIASSVKNLVFITHGWTDNATDVNGWVVQMEDAIQNKLPDSSWGVCAYDWRNSAHTLAPWDAFNSARSLGEHVGSVLAKGNFTSIHFIAHSAGSNLIQNAASWIRKNVPVAIRPRTQLTFLDAYDPANIFSSYGSDPIHPSAQYSTDIDWWAEQAVDMRGGKLPGDSALTDILLDNVLDDTNIVLSRAYNFDVTALDPIHDPTPLELQDQTFESYLARVHAWPHAWYQESIVSSSLHIYGFPFSIEGGNRQLPIQYFPGGHCTLTSEITPCSTTPSLLQNVAFYFHPIDLLKSSVADVFEKSKTGIVAIVNATKAILRTGSPVWFKLPVVTTSTVNVMKFDYQFLSDVGAQGMASVEVDGQPVYEIDERVAPAGVNGVKDIWVGNLEPGQHTISFRLDPFTAVPSVLSIADIELGLIQQERITDTIAPTTTASASGSLGKNHWYTSAVSVHLDAEDNAGGVGVQQTFYSLDGGPVQTYNTSTPISVVSDGVHTLQYSSVDFFGNSEATNTLAINIDIAPPTIFHSAVAPTYVLNARPMPFAYSAADSVSGLAHATATLDGLQIPTSTILNFAIPGSHSIVISASDLAGNTTSTIINYTTAYNFGGFLPPVKTGGIYTFGVTLPIKFQLTDASGNFISTAKARLFVASVKNGIVSTTSVSLTGNNLFRYDAANNQYIYNLNTSQLTAGTWQLKVVLDDGKSYMVLVSLR